MFFALLHLLCYPFDLWPNVSKVSVDGNLLFASIKRRAEDTDEADVLKPTYLFI